VAATRSSRSGPAPDRPTPRLVVAIINGACVYYLSAIAVAIGFRMNLFNIGVDGQYRVAAFAPRSSPVRPGCRAR
jgi:hypothetical protein